MRMYMCPAHVYYVSTSTHTNTQSENYIIRPMQVTAVLATTIRLPTTAEVRKLSMSDIAIAAGLADELRDRLREYIHIDPYCLPDPFGEKDDYNYSIVLDTENPNRVVAIFVNKKDSPLPQLPWSAILGKRLVKVPIGKQEAYALKHELMPKETNNFYPYRRNGRIVGYMMFAFQICGKR